MQFDHSLMIICLAIQVIFFLLLLVKGKNRFAQIHHLHEYPLRLRSLVPIGWMIVEQCRIMERWPMPMNQLQHYMILLFGRKHALLHTKLCISEWFTFSYVILCVSTLFSVCMYYDWSIFAAGVVFTIIVPYVSLRELQQRIRIRQHRILLELPELLNQIVLLVNAGETVTQAIIRCSDNMNHYVDSPLCKELQLAVNELKVSVSFTKVMEDFSKRCAIHEISLFANAMLLNYRKGGSDFVFALSSLHHELWQKRKAISRTLGEEASSKLVFPMVLIFVVVMVIVGSPAILMMNG